MNAALLLSALAAALCCSPPPAPAPRVDAGSPADCQAACDRLAELGCEEAQPTPGGASCVEVCNNTEQSGAVTLDPACVATIATCAAIDGCAQ